MSDNGHLLPSIFVLHNVSGAIPDESYSLPKSDMRLCLPLADRHSCIVASGMMQFYSLPTLDVLAADINENLQFTLDGFFGLMDQLKE